MKRILQLISSFRSLSGYRSQTPSHVRKVETAEIFLICLICLTFLFQQNYNKINDVPHTVVYFIYTFYCNISILFTILSWHYTVTQSSIYKFITYLYFPPNPQSDLRSSEYKPNLYKRTNKYYIFPKSICFQDPCSAIPRTPFLEYKFFTIKKLQNIYF